MKRPTIRGLSATCVWAAGALLLGGCAMATGAPVDEGTSSQSSDLNLRHDLTLAKGELGKLGSILGPRGSSPQPVVTSCAMEAYDGQATCLDLTAGADLGTIDVGATLVVSDTGPLAIAGGAAHAHLLDANVAGIVVTGVLDADTRGGNGRTSSTASTDQLAIDVAGVHIGADVLLSSAQASCEPTGIHVSGGANIAGLVIGGHPVVVTGAPNQTIDVGPVHVVIDEIVEEPASSSQGTILVDALHVSVVGLLDLVVSRAAAGITCDCIDTPTFDPSPAAL